MYMFICIVYMYVHIVYMYVYVYMYVHIGRLKTIMSCDDFWWLSNQVIALLLYVHSKTITWWDKWLTTIASHDSFSFPTYTVWYIYYTFTYIKSLGKFRSETHRDNNWVCKVGRVGRGKSMTDWNVS